jgi:hypothetical protein
MCWSSALEYSAEELGLSFLGRGPKIFGGAARLCDSSFSKFDLNSISLRISAKAKL